MTPEKKFTLAEAHLNFAKSLQDEAWSSLEKQDRSLDEEERMINAAHASLYHWLQAGTPVNRQRGEYLLARVYTAAALGDDALRHARRCVQLTRDNLQALEDFDVAYSYECLARAHAAAGNIDNTRLFLEEARKAGSAISDPEDRKTFETQLKGGDWFGVE